MPLNDDRRISKLEDIVFRGNGQDALTIRVSSLEKAMDAITLAQVEQTKVSNELNLNLTEVLTELKVRNAIAKSGNDRHAKQRQFLQKTLIGCGIAGLIELLEHGSSLVHLFVQVLN